MKKTAAFIAMHLIFTLATSATVFAAENTEDNPPVRYISESEYYALLENMHSTGAAVPYVTTCCDKPPRLIWKHVSTAHASPSGGGRCLGVLYFGDQYCTHCGTVWQYDTCYKQLGSCGKVH